MKNICLFAVLLWVSTFGNYAGAQNEGIYDYNWKIDAPITAVGSGLTLWGFSELSAKETLDPDEIIGLTPADVPKFDRSAARRDITSDDHPGGDILMFGPIPLTFLNFIDKEARQEWWEISLLYLEAYAITGAIYGMTAAFVDRKRPYVFNPEVNIDSRTSRHARNSFIGGHPAVTSTATFFAAKLFHDYHPDSPWRFVIWPVAAALPAGTAYFRWQGGNHFPSDLLVGYWVGAGSSLLVLELHKNKKLKDRVQISPFFGPGQGLSFSYKF